MLSVLLAPMDDQKASAALTKMLPMFAKIPDGAFSDEACEHIASQCKRVPNYAELREKLAEWWKEHRPPPPPDPLSQLTRADEIAREAANRASWNDAPAIRASVRLVLSSPVQQFNLGRMLGKAVAVNAPHYLGLVPAEWHPTEGDRL